MDPAGPQHLSQGLHIQGASRFLPSGTSKIAPGAQTSPSLWPRGKRLQQERERALTQADVLSSRGSRSESRQSWPGRDLRDHDTYFVDEDTEAPIGGSICSRSQSEGEYTRTGSAEHYRWSSRRCGFLFGCSAVI